MVYLETKTCRTFHKNLAMSLEMVLESFLDGTTAQPLDVSKKFSVLSNSSAGATPPLLGQTIFWSGSDLHGPCLHLILHHHHSAKGATTRSISPPSDSFIFPAALFPQRFTCRLKLSLRKYSLPGVAQLS
jgi:hypothetical protein